MLMTHICVTYLNRHGHIASVSQANVVHQRRVGIFDLLIFCGELLDGYIILHRSEEKIFLSALRQELIQLIASA